MVTDTTNIFILQITDCLKKGTSITETERQHCKEAQEQRRRKRGVHVESDIPSMKPRPRTAFNNGLVDFSSGVNLSTQLKE